MMDNSKLKEVVSDLRRYMGVRKVYLTEKAPEFVGVKDKRRNTFLLAAHLYEVGIDPRDLLYLLNTGRLPVDLEYKLRENFELSELIRAYEMVKGYGVEELRKKGYIPVKVKAKEFFEYLDDVVRSLLRR